MTTRDNAHELPTWMEVATQAPAPFDTGEPWHPITDPVELKYLIKSIEELGEEVSILARLTIQGWEGIDPKTGNSNRECLENEIADVMASNQLLIEKFNLDHMRILKRAGEKMEFLRPLHEAAGKMTPGS